MLKNDIFKKAEDLKNKLLKTVYDQNDAIEDIINALIQSNYKEHTNLPRCIFTFIGGNSSGKAYLAQKIADSLTDITNFRSFNMAQFTNVEEGYFLYAISPDKESNQEGELIRFVREYPQSVLLFEDIDKADPQVQFNLLTVLTHNEGMIDFSKCIVVFSTSLGRELYQSSHFLNSFKVDKIRAQARLVESLLKEKKVVMDTIQGCFSAKLISFMAQNTIVLFNSLSLNANSKIGLNSLNNVLPSFMEKTGVFVELETPEILSKLITLSFSPYINALLVQKKLPELIFSKVTEFIKKEKKLPAKVIFKVSKGTQEFISNLFTKHPLLDKELERKHQYIKLKWKEELNEKILTINLINASLKKIPDNITVSVQDRIPIIESSNIRFNDIAGQTKVKKNLKEIINILKRPKLVDKFKIDMPKGLLLFGPKGVGKRLLAQAFIKETGMPFIKISGSDLFDQFYLHEVYQKAKEYSPCIVFLDEVDIKGIVDGVITNMPTEFLISELQSIKHEKVFTIATAQQKEGLDPNLLMPGKIDMFVEVPELDKEARRFYINKILKKPNDGKINVERVVHYISGMNGDDLERLGREAALGAIKHNLEYITEEILIEQINVIKYGTKLEGNKLKNFEEDLKKTAYHEAGHAIISMVLRPEIKIEQVTISPRSESLGFVSYNIEDYLNNVTKEEMKGSICVSLAGSLAKQKKFGKDTLDSGAINDFEQATAEAYVAISALGMDDEIGHISVGGLGTNISNFLNDKIQERVLEWLRESKNETERLLEQYWDKVEELALQLISNEVVEGFELEKIMSKKVD